MSTPPPPPSPSGERVRSGRVVAGALLILLGIGWLLEVLDVVDFPWDLLLPAALIVVGVALLWASRAGAGQGGLITTGVVLTAVLVLGSAVDFPLAGGIGEREERPTVASALRAEYGLGVGELTLDLRELTTPTTDERTRVRVGIGQLVVIVPDDLSVAVRARATIGTVRVFGDEEGGVGAERTTAASGVDPVVDLVLSVGIGEIEVRRG